MAVVWLGEKIEYHSDQDSVCAFFGRPRGQMVLSRESFSDLFVIAKGCPLRR